MTDTNNKPMPQTEEEWKKVLTPEQYAVLREKGTEAPFTGKFYRTDKEGTFKCVACGNQLFASDAQFHSDIPGLAGWPSFDEAIPGSITFLPDDTHGMSRTEVVCSRCHSHLGHIFDDAQAKTGKHFCVNSVCLDLEEKK